MITATILNFEDFDAIVSPDERLMAWRETQALMKAIVATEAKMRDAVFDQRFPGVREDITTGLKNLDLGKGYILKGTPSQNYKLDKEKVDDVFDRLHKKGGEVGLLIERAVVFKPDLSITEYKKLDPKKSKAEATVKEAIDAILTITPGKPTLELVEPKG